MNRNLHITSLFILVFFLFWFGAPKADAAAPTVTTLAPSTAAIGASVTITGTNFGSTGTVTFNGKAATTSSWSATSIVTTVPIGATTGNVIVTVSGVTSNAKTFTVVPAPVISALSITAGAQGAAVSITGTGFGSTQGLGTVKFNGTLATITTWTATSIAVKVPTGATTGNVVVFASGVNSVGIAFTVVAAPSITSLSISTGAVGALVTITGTGFGSSQGTSNTVKFNGTTATASTWTATSIVTTVPTGATTGNVVVHASGVDSTGASFTIVSAPTITSLSVTTGAVSAAVSVHGANFGTTQGLGTVKFNGTTAAVTNWGSSTIAVTVPTGATTGNVVVFASGVNSGGSAFTVVPAPSITSLSNSSGATGTTVTLAGTSFGSPQGSGTVKFNGTSATISSWTATSIAVTVPSAATTGNIVVFASGVNSNGKTFTVTPTISSLSPSSGAVNASVTIAGTGFGANQLTSTVAFNGTAATVTGWTNTSISTTVPAAATTGTVVVTVAGFASNGKTFTLKPTPTVSSSAPAFGAVGVAVAITGTNLGTSGTITFNGMIATASAWAANQISVLVPAGATTGPLVITASGVNLNCGNFIVETISSLVLSPATVSLPINSVQQFIATANYSDGKSQPLGAAATWTSSNLNIGTISPTGVLTTTELGVTTIQATFNSFNAVSSVTVRATSFTFVGDLNTPRYSHTATLLQGGKVLIVGGLDVNNKELASAELYDPIAQTFSPTGSLLYPLAGHSATLLPSGKVLIAGGGSNGVIVPSAELYDPVAGTFSYTTGFMTEGHSSHTATLLNTGQVLIAGGSYNGSGGYQRADSELYDPSTDTFTVTGNMVTPRENHTATLLANGNVVIIGGDTLNAQFQTYYVGPAEIYNPSNGTFTAVGSLSSASEYHDSQLLSTGKVVVIDGEYYCSTCNAPLLSRTETYDPTAQAFSSTVSMAIARFVQTSTTLTDGTILVVGGEAQTIVNGQITGYTATGGAELLNTTSQTVTGAGALQDPRASHTATLLNDGTVLFVGGAGSRGVLASAELYAPTLPKPFSLLVTPTSVSISVGASQQFTAVNNNGVPRSDVIWSVSNPSVATISSGATPVLTALAAGTTNLTASVDGVSAQAQISVYASGSNPAPGAALWSIPPVPGYVPQQLAEAMPSNPPGPDIYSIQTSTDGSRSVIQAMTSDGQQLWQSEFPALNASGVPDAFGGIIVVQNQTCLQNQTAPMSIVAVNPATGEPFWQIMSQGIPNAGVGGSTLYCYPAAPQIAVRVQTDGAVVIAAPGNTAGLPEIQVVNGITGQSAFLPLIPESSYTNTDGSITNGYSPIGAPIVDSDGTTYVEYEVRSIANPPKVTSASLYLLKISPSNATSSILLNSTTADENLFPGKVIPDGNGNLLATWSVSPSNPPIPMNPYQAAYVSGGAVSTIYSLPFTPKNFVLGPDGLPLSVSLVFGESGIAFATDSQDRGDITNNQGPKVVAFEAASGAVVWSYQVSTGSNLSIMSALTGNAVQVNDSQAGVTQLSSTGAASQVSGQLGGVAQTSWEGLWDLQNTTLGAARLQPSQRTLALSYWAMPAGNQSGNGAAVIQAQTNQAQTLAEQLPDLSDPSRLYCSKNYLDLIEHGLPYIQTCGNINAIELLSTSTPDAIFQKYVTSFLPVTSNNNSVMTFTSSTGGAPVVSGGNQQLLIRLQNTVLNFTQPPFSIMTERYDSVNHVISVVTLHGHPLAGWRYFRVYSIGTNDVVVETGGYDQPAPGPLNWAGYFLGTLVLSRAWHNYLQFIQNDLGAPQGSNLQGTLGGIQEPLYPYDPDSLLDGYWDIHGLFTNYILTNVCVSPPCQ
jgi:hypothetical protein